MIERNEIAIADLLRHKTLGIVSPQPQGDEKSDEIWVRNENWSLYHVYLADCEWPAEDDEKANNFWKRLKELGYMNPDDLPPKKKRRFVGDWTNIKPHLGDLSEGRKTMGFKKLEDLQDSRDYVSALNKYLDIIDNELDRIHALLRYPKYEKEGGDYDYLVKVMYRFQSELLKFGKVPK